jgi:hypothetical protein
MVRNAWRVSQILSLPLILVCSALAGPVPVGTQPLGSYSGGPFDLVNLGNLNVHFAIPILHKAGRGLPFTYDLTYDNSIWYPVTSNGVTSWKSVGGWGWHGLGPVVGSYVTYSVTYEHGSCYNGNLVYFDHWTYGDFVYHDTLGASHTFGIRPQYYNSPGGSMCPPNGQVPATIPPSGSGTGYTLNISSVNAGGPQSEILQQRAGRP